MSMVLSPSMVAAVIAEAADSQGVTPSWLASQPDALAKLGLDPSIITESLVHKATRLFRTAINLVVGRASPAQVASYGPSVAMALDAVDTPTLEAKEGKRVVFRGPKLFGKYSLTAVVRRLSQEGWSREDIWFFLGQEQVGGHGMSQATVKTQMQWGLKGHGGPPAPLTAKELKWCQEVCK